METMVKPPRTGLEAFELLPEGTLCQLINDAIIMSPAPTPNHQRFSKRIFLALEKYVFANDLGEVLFAPLDVYLNNKNVYQPDIIFVSKDNLQIIEGHKGINGAPDLIVEILSKGNKHYDLNDKKHVYETAGVKEYWVVDPMTKWCCGFVLLNGYYNAVGETSGHLTIRMFNLTITF